MFTVEEIEKAALSSVMQSPQAANEAAARLTPPHFTLPAHRTIFCELLNVWNDGQPFDLILFTHRLRQGGLLDQVGGAGAVTSIHGHVPSGANIRYYIELLDDAYDTRRAREVLTAGSQAVESEGAAALPEIIASLAEIPLRRVKPRSFKDAIMDKIDRMETGEPDADILRTGIALIDSNSPLRRGDMPLVSGERKAGKSILALSIATNVARTGIPVLYFSLEDREPKVIDRMFAGVSRVPMHSHHAKQMTASQMDQATKAASTLAELAFYLRDDIYDLHKLIAVARQEKASHDIGLIVIDYAQLVRSAGADSRREEVEKVSRDLRLLAMELDVPLLLLCQLNKEGETRESKALEMDATAMWRIDEIEDTGKRQIAIPWQRNGESNIAFRVAFLGSTARVENLDQSDDESGVKKECSSERALLI